MSAATGVDFRTTLIRVDTISGGGGHGRHPDIEQLELVSAPGLAMIGTILQLRPQEALKRLAG